jgi:hypothetical protein
MSKNSKLKNTFSSIILLLFAWVIYFIFIFLNGEKINSNHLYIPQNSTFVCKIDAKEILSTSADQILLKDKNEQILRTFKNLLANPNRKKSAEIGVDIFSDVIIFTTPYHKGKLIGFSFNLISPELFKKNISEYLTKDQTFAIHNHVGIVYHFIPNDPTVSIPISEIKKFVSNSITYKTYAFEKSNNVIDIQLYKSYFDPETTINSSKIKGKIKNDELIIEGDLSLKNKLTTKASFLKPNENSFHFSSLYFPKSLNVSLRSLLHNIKIDVPEIQSLSMNYNGIEFGNLNNEMVVIPGIDLLITTKENFSITDYLKTNLTSIHDEIIFENNKVIIGEYIYFVQQITPTTFYLGKTEKPILISNSNQTILEMKGDLSNFVNVKGGGFMMSILEMYPLYKASKKFIKSTEQFELKFKAANSKYIRISGSLKFKKDHFITSESLLFLLGSGLIE